MVDLTEDIWRIIVQYLDKQEVEPLLRVNSLLRDIALDVVYEHLSLDLSQLHDRECLPTADYLAQPWISSRVRRLTINMIQSSRFSRRPTIQSKLKSSFRHSVTRLNNRLRGHNKEEAAQRLAHSFVNLRGLHLFYDHDNETEEFLRQLPLLISTMEHYSSRLSSITFVVTSFDFLPLILPTLPDFLVLEKISFRFHCYTSRTPQSELVVILRDIIPTFINRHTKTLSSLEIIPDTFSKDQDFSIIFERIAPIPHLKTVDVPFIRGQPDSSNQNVIGRFIAKHSESLQTLSLFVPRLRFTPTEARKSFFDFIYTSLPHLKHLSITYITGMKISQYEDSMSSPDLTEYIGKYSTGLRSLDVGTRGLVRTDWDAINAMKWSSLVSLRLRVLAVTPRLFEDIAQHFPCLKSLSLVRVKSFGASWVLDKREDTATFYVLMHLKKFPESPLSHLELHHESDQSSHPHVEIRSPYSACVAAVVVAFPNIVYVNGRARGDFLKEVEMVWPSRSSEA